MPDFTPRAQAEAAARREREATALRENLRRRKAQVRAKQDDTAAQAPTGARVSDVTFTDTDISVALEDGTTITRPLSLYPRLAHATPAQRSNWEVSGAGHGIHWPDVDEDVSVEALQAGEGAPPGSEHWRSPLLTSDD